MSYGLRGKWENYVPTHNDKENKISHSFIDKLW
jgi:hypothetical protein